MARRVGGINKGVEEKRKALPIYQHYTLSPGKTKSHHPEAKCNHCLKEFVCGSKQRLIRHLRKCNSISNPDQIIAETLNTLAKNSATGQLNHSILEASNLLPSQLSHHIPSPHYHHIIGQQLNLASQTTANSNTNNNNSNSTNNNNVSNHNTGGSNNNDNGLIAGSSNSSMQSPAIMNATPMKRPQRRGRKPANHNSGIHMTTGLDGKTHFTPASQMPGNLTPGTVNSPIIAAHGRASYGYQQAQNSGAAGAISPGHLVCANAAATAYKLNSELIDRAYLKLVLTRNLPLSLCDTKEFQGWVRTFANDYKPPSSVNLISHNLKEEAQSARQRISNILVKAPKKTINLELHRWPDSPRGHLWYALIANVDTRRFLVSVRDIHLDISSQTGNGSSESNPDKFKQALSDFIDECIKRLGSDRVNNLIFSGSPLDDPIVLKARNSLYTVHPSIVTYYCWWHFTNSLCADIIDSNKEFNYVMKSSNRLIHFINNRPKLGKSLEKFAPFGDVSPLPCLKRNDRRWYSHVVCYLLGYLKNNQEAIMKAIEAYSMSLTTMVSGFASDNELHANSDPELQESDLQQVLKACTQQHTELSQENAHLDEIKSIIMSTEFWDNLNLASVYLKPINDIVALTSIIPSNQNATINNSSNNNGGTTANGSNGSIQDEVTPIQQATPMISPVVANIVSLADYMHWFLSFGKTLFDSWHQSPEVYKYNLIFNFLTKFHSSVADFKLLFAAYLLNPKHRCAYVTPKAKETAIVEILNIASEFMPEESDGHTIFDQWKLYLVREEPYDMVYDESRSNPLEWWMSLPCAESIRRVALRILRLRAFTSPKQENLYSQLYFYEDESRSDLNSSSFEDIAVLRYFYDFEDKIGQPGSSHGSMGGSVHNSSIFNGFHDRTQVSQLHNQPLINAFDVVTGINGQVNDSLSSNETRPNASETFSDVVIESYLNPHSGTIGSQAVLTQSDVGRIEDIPGYSSFFSFVDYNEAGVQVVEEPVEKKKRKWTAQEILSKCQ